MAFKDDAARLALQNYVLKMLGDENRALRADVAEGMRERYERDGVRQVAAEFGGERVGTVSATVSKARAALSVDDPEAFAEWADENDYLLWDVDMRAVEDRFERTGEVPPGCSVKAVPGSFKGISVRFDKEAKAGIARLMGESYIGDAMRELIGGGE